MSPGEDWSNATSDPSGGRLTRGTGYGLVVMSIVYAAPKPSGFAFP